jgi:fatty acid desaturase
MADLNEMPIAAQSGRQGTFRSMNEYAREIRPHLPPAIFQRAPVRLLWLPLHSAVIIALAILVVHAAPPWYVALMCGLIIGHSWGCLGFLAHETLHHAVTKSRRVERMVGYLAFLPYWLSPTLWVAWHNQTHHAYTGHLFADPDHFGTLQAWQKNAYLRRLEALAPGSGKVRSAAFLFIALTMQGLLVLLLQSERKGFYRRVSRRAVYGETVSMVGFWLATLWLVGPWNFLFVAIVPALSANALLMSYISTNHYLNPLTSTNDPLANSLSVTNPRLMEALHLQFGYHVEHHIFPTMSAKHSRAVREVLIDLYGERYLSVSHHRALLLLYARPKLHLQHDSLINPRTNEVFRALSPGNLSMLPVAPSPAHSAPTSLETGID